MLALDLYIIIKSIEQRPRIILKMRKQQFQQDLSYQSSKVQKKDDQNDISIYSNLNSKKIKRRKRSLKLKFRKLPTDQKIKKINAKKGKSLYQRSNNNSHKKFICIAKRLLLGTLFTENKIQIFQNAYSSFKNSRAYFFIILAYVKFTFTQNQKRRYLKDFQLYMSNKIQVYQRQISKTNNLNFINFRANQIADLQFAREAIHLYFQGKMVEAVELVYRKEKTTILKRSQFQDALKRIKITQDQLKLKYPQVQEVKKQDNQPQQQLLSSFEALQINIPNVESNVEFSNQLKQEAESQIKISKQTPLLFLQNSFPLNPDYFSYYLGFIQKINFIKYNSYENQVYLSPQIQLFNYQYRRLLFVKQCIHPQQNVQFNAFITSIYKKTDKIPATDMTVANQKNDASNSIKEVKKQVQLQDLE